MASTDPFDQPRPDGAPDSPFFRRLSAAVIANDEASEQPDYDLDAYAASLGVNVDEAKYMAHRRLDLVHALMPSVATMAGGAWLDGFLAAMKMKES